MAKLIPIRNLIYVIPLEDPDTSPGGIIIPEQAKQKVDQGIIYVRPKDSDLRVGDHVLFSGYTGDQITVEGIGTIYVIPEPFILAVIDDDDPSDVLVPIRLVDDMVKRALGFMAMGGHEESELAEFEERFNSLLHDHLFTEFQF